MAPAYSGGVFRIPQQDDIDGLHAMYELPAGSAEAEASCDGPFLLGEYCSCNDDCVEGLLCVAQDDGAQICSRTCDGDNPDCGSGFNCILGEAPASSA